MVGSAFRDVLFATVVLALTTSACSKKPQADASEKKQQAAVMKAAVKAVVTSGPARADSMRLSPRARPIAAAMTAMRPRPAADGKAYRILFERPLRPGQRYRLLVKVRKDSRPSVDGKPIAHLAGETSHQYEALVTVKAVDSKGWATREEHLVVRLKKTEKGKTTDVLAAKAVVIASVSGGTKQYTVDGKPAPKAVLRYLRAYIKLNAIASASDNDVYSPGVPKKPGDQWKVNAQKLLEQVERSVRGRATLPEAKDVVSRVWLAGPKRINGVNTLTVSSVVEVNKIVFRIPTLKGTAGTMKLEQTAYLPVDTRSIGYTLKGRATTRMHGWGHKKGKKVVIRIQATLFTEHTKTPLK